jgi:hypothetical protein
MRYEVGPDQQDWCPCKNRRQDTKKHIDRGVCRCRKGLRVKPALLAP